MLKLHKMQNAFFYHGKLPEGDGFLIKTQNPYIFITWKLEHVLLFLKYIFIGSISIPPLGGEGWGGRQKTVL